MGSARGGAGLELVALDALAHAGHGAATAMHPHTWDAALVLLAVALAGVLVARLGAEKR